MFAGLCTWKLMRWWRCCSKSHCCISSHKSYVSKLGPSFSMVLCVWT